MFQTIRLWSNILLKLIKKKKKKLIKKSSLKRYHFKDLVGDASDQEAIIKSVKRLDLNLPKYLHRKYPFILIN